MYNVTYTSLFKNQLKRLLKKYPKSEDEFKKAIEEISDGELIGVEYDNLCLPESESAYKVMVANIDTQRSPKNGFRFIYYVIKNNFEVYLLSVYSKIEIQNLKQSQVKDLIKQYCK